MSTDPEDIFEVLELIGEGSFGCVYRGRHRLSGRIVALKIMTIDDNVNSFMKEVAMLKECKSDYIVRYHGSYMKNGQIWIVMEYCGGGSLRDLMMKGKFPLREEEIRYVMAELLIGLVYMHDQKKIHRVLVCAFNNNKDIKAGNILMNDSGVVKLADFGVSVQMDSTMSKRQTIIGTPFWMAPEIIQEASYDCLADIWSVGITAIELAEGLPPLANIPPMKAIFLIPNRPPPRLQAESKWSSEFVDFVRSCLVKDPQQRPSARQLIEHPFISNLVKKLMITRGKSNTMKHMVNRLQELKRKCDEGRPVEKKIEKVNPVNVDESEFAAEPNKARVSISSGDSREKVYSCARGSLDESDRIVSCVSKNARSSPADVFDGINAAGPNSRYSITRDEKKRLSAGSDQGQRESSQSAPKQSAYHRNNNSSRNVLEINSGINSPTVPSLIDLLAESSLPIIPSQKSLSINNTKDWARLRQRGIVVTSQFKKDIDRLINSYSGELTTIINAMNNCN